MRSRLYYQELRGLLVSPQHTGTHWSNILLLNVPSIFIFGGGKINVMLFQKKQTSPLYKVTFMSQA